MVDDSEIFNCYSVRRLNPFLGVVQIVESNASRAICVDGINWEIQILTERPQDTWASPSPAKQPQQYIRFGVWNKADGLGRVPANPLLDLTKMFAETNRIIAILDLESENIPFPLQDRFELWLLDDINQMPLALLASTTESQRLPMINVAHWVSADQHFYASHRKASQQAIGDSNNPKPDKNILQAAVARRAQRGYKHWFKRTAGDRGEPQSSTHGTDIRSPHTTLSADAFPLLLLSSSWEDNLARSLVADYLSWLSPYLLTLQNLPDELRIDLERKATKRATVVANCWRFYPRIIDRNIIDAARVEARIRQSRIR